MKALKYHIIHFLLTLLVVSCVSDDGVFEETPKASGMQESIAIVNVLQQLRITGMELEEDLCFRFIYPLNLGYNTGAYIEVKDFKGFKEMVFNQTTGFNVSKVDFPFSVMIKTTGEVVNIASETQLNTLIIDCGFSTVRQDVLEFLGSCFAVQYPIDIKNTSNEENSITSDAQLRNFIIEQGTTYQPDFVFPITLISQNNSNQEEVQSNFDLLKFIETCEKVTNPTPCATADFEISKLSDGGYSIMATTDQSASSYEWTRNGEIVPEWQNNVTVVMTDKEPGTYEICLMVTNTNVDCQSEVTFCDILVIEKPCIDLSYSRLEPFLIVSDPTTAPFTWFVNGVETDDGSDSEGGFSLIRFPDGVYEICVENTPDPTCDAIANYCEMVEIDYCYEVSFGFTSEANIYTFNGEITSSSGSVNPNRFFGWYVDDVFIENDGPDLFGGDNQLIYTFASPGTYEVCMRTTNGPDARCLMAEFCETITVP